MTNHPHTIGLLFSNPADRRLLTQFVEEQGHQVWAPAEPPPEIWPELDLILLDAEAGRQYGPAVLTAKQRIQDVFAPVLVALTSGQDPTPWLKAGFDDVLRLPITKAELQARLGVFLRLREHSLAVQERTRALAESEARYRQLVESPLVGVWIADPQGRFVFVNQRLAQLAGYDSPDEIVGRMTMLDAVAPERRAWLQERLQRWRMGMLAADLVEVEMLRKDGSRFTALVAPAGLLDGEGRFAGFIGAMIDISERKRLEQELAERVAEQERLLKLMVGREIRMAELKDAIRQLRQQLLDAGLRPVAGDPLVEDEGDKVTG